MSAKPISTTLKSWWRTFTTGEMVVLPASLTGVAVAIASIAIGAKRGDIRVDVALASMATFLFGVLLAFTIVRTRERLAQVQDLVAKSNASLFSLHQMVAVFSGDDCRRVRGLIDEHLTDQIDYRLVDHELAAPSYIRLTDAVHALIPDTRQEDSVYRELVALCIEMRENRALIEAAAGQEMSSIEWVGLLLLLVVLFGLIAILPGGTILGAIVAGTLAGAVVTLMILLRRLDLLRWHERVTIWEPTTRLFRSMGLDPYVPQDVILSGRYRPTGRIRVVEYVDPYPDRSTKRVRTLDLGPAGANGDGRLPSRVRSTV